MAPSPTLPPELLGRSVRLVWRASPGLLGIHVGQSRSAIIVGIGPPYGPWRARRLLMEVEWNAKVVSTMMVDAGDWVGGFLDGREVGVSGYEYGPQGGTAGPFNATAQLTHEPPMDLWTRKRQLAAAPDPGPGALPRVDGIMSYKSEVGEYRLYLGPDEETRTATARQLVEGGLALLALDSHEFLATITKDDHGWCARPFWETGVLLWDPEGKGIPPPLADP